MQVITKAVLTGMLIAFAGTMPRNIIFLANLQYFPCFPWGVPVVAIYLWYFWRYLNGLGKPIATSDFRKNSLRARKLSADLWIWSLLAGGIGIVALVVFLRLLNRMIVLPEQKLPDFTNIPPITVYALLFAAAPIAGIIEEAAFRGYMQGPIEKRYGLIVAILITGTMFAVAHLDFTLLLWPYYVAVAAIYGTVAYLTKSILPSIALHTLGNTYSNFDLLFKGHTEWQTPTEAGRLIWSEGADSSFWIMSIIFLLLLVTSVGAYLKLAAIRKNHFIIE